MAYGCAACIIENMKKISFNSPVILTFALVSAAVLVLNKATVGWSNAYIFSVYRTSWSDPMQYVRLFAHVLGHSDINHYISNMMIFLLAGPMLEEKYGSGRILAIILATAGITGLVHIMLSPDTALLGASGIDFAFILLASVTGTKRGIPMTTILCAVLYIGSEVYRGLFVKDSIAQSAHIIGGCLGAFYGMLLKKKKSR